MAETKTNKERLRDLEGRLDDIGHNLWLLQYRPGRCEYANVNELADTVSLLESMSLSALGLDQPKEGSLRFRGFRFWRYKKS